MAGGSDVRIGRVDYIRLVSASVFGWLARGLYHPPERYAHLLYTSAMTVLAIGALWALWVIMVRSSRPPKKPE